MPDDELSQAGSTTGPSDARAAVSFFAGLFGLLAIWSALALDPEACPVSLRVRLAGIAVGAVLIASALAAVIEGTSAKYAGSSRKVNLALGVLGWLLLVPWTGVVWVISICH